MAPAYDAVTTRVHASSRPIADDVGFDVSDRGPDTEALQLRVPQGVAGVFRRQGIDGSLRDLAERDTGPLDFSSGPVTTAFPAPFLVITWSLEGGIPGTIEKSAVTKEP
jgi:hypothetical protein